MPNVLLLIITITNENVLLLIITMPNVLLLIITNNPVIYKNGSLSRIAHP